MKISISYILIALFVFSAFSFKARYFVESQPFVDTFQAPESEALNVKDFGALGDKIHDDGPAIQKALDKAATMNGATVYFPDGFYLVVDPGNGDSGAGKYGLQVSSNTTMSLAANATLHKKGNDEILSNKDQVKGNDKIIITGGNFETDSGTDQKWAPTRIGIKFVNVSNSQVRNCSFRHIGNSGISLQKNSDNNVISGCSFTDIFNCAVEVLSGKKNTITRNHLHDMGSDGILVNGDECLVSYNRMENIGKYSAPSLGSGISLGVDNMPCSNNKVLNNTIAGAAAYGIINDRGANTLIQGNTISNTGSSAIKIGQGGHHSVVNKNIIRNTGLSKESKGIYIHTGIIVDGANVAITNNKLTNVTGTGIYLNETATNSIVRGCTVATTKRAANEEVKAAAIEVKAANTNVKKIKQSNIAN